MNLSPAFQFYPADFLADENVAVMSLAGRGAYITLLCYCWREGSIPADFVRMGRMCGVDSSAIAQLWAELDSCFEKVGDRYINPRLERERIKQIEFRSERQDSGRRGAEARWLKTRAGKTKENQPDSANFQSKEFQKNKTGSAIAEPIAEPIAVDGSSVFSLQSSEEKEKEEKKKKVSPAKRCSTRPTVCDEEFLKSLQANPAYARLDVGHVFGKMVAWCGVHRKQPTRARLVNWLNREDVPMAIPEGNGNGSALDHRYPTSRGNENGKSIRETAGNRRARRLLEILSDTSADEAGSSDHGADPDDPSEIWPEFA